jgi:glycine/D-amino acid oxidase-like deaminating enzyme
MSLTLAGIGTDPYWWDEAPRHDENPPGLPAQVDVLIVGGGFSGLCAARVLAKAGKSVLVCESEYIGYGASTRNGGMLGPSFHKLGVAGLKACYGAERTHAILRESIGFIDGVAALIEDENIDCDFYRSGRFRCASRPEHYEQMSRDLEPLVEKAGLEAEMIPAARVREEIGSDRFYGGVYYHNDGGLHPAKYHDGLIKAVRAAGAQVAPATRVTGLQRSPDGDGFRVSTSRGTVRADQVAICTNGYTGKITPWFRRRLLPIRSAMIATEELAPELMQQLMPTRRMYGDSRRVMAYYRPSPDGKRILFGGRAAGPGDRPDTNARDLRRFLVDIFPQLEKIRITHVWSGLIAYTFDHAPHLGEQDGLFYAMGYCGSGVARSTFFGDKLGHKMLADGKGDTAFDDLPFASRPLYTGTPWFMPAIIRWHRFIDRLGM